MVKSKNKPPGDDEGVSTPTSRNVRVLAALGEKGWVLFDGFKPSTGTLERVSEQAGQAVRHALGEMPGDNPEVEPPTQPAA
jgi:hypothetical protein